MTRRAREAFRSPEVKRGPVPTEVLDYWTSKGLKPSFSYKDVWNAEHDLAFSAAKIMRVDVLNELHKELGKAIEQGMPFAQWKKELEPRLQRLGWWAPHEVEDQETGKVAKVDPPSRLRLIYDTNMRTARAVGQWERIQRTKAQRPYLLYQVGPSVRHREQHLAWHGLLLPVDDPFWASAFPPNGYGCFLPGTRITGTIVGASKARYAGEAIEVKTQSGATLSVTANHPIATTRGWIRAGDLRVGDYCISHRSEVELVSGSRGPDTTRRAVGNEHIPPMVQDVFKALSSHGTRSTEVSPLDFHGEAQRFVGQVDVVGSYVELVQHVESTRAQFAGQLALAWSDRTLITEQSEGHVAALAHRVLAATSGVPSGLALPHGLIPTHALPSFSRSFGAPAHVNATTLQKAGEGHAAHGAFVGELLDRNASDVALDQVVSVRRFPYCGHVYDLESESGWILAGGIVASNCKCHVRTVSQREYDEMQTIERPEVDEEGRRTGGVVSVPVVRTAPQLTLVPWMNERTGVLELVPQGIDPGFNRRPGEGRRIRLADIPEVTTPPEPPPPPPEIEPQHWLDKEYSAKYGDKAGKAVAWGRAMMHRGLDVSIEDAKRHLADFQNMGVTLSQYWGDLFEERAKPLITDRVVTLGQLLERMESQPKPAKWAPEMGEVKALAALIGHRSAMSTSTKNRKFAAPRFDKNAPKAVKDKAIEVLARVRKFWSEMTHADVEHADKSHGYVVKWIPDRAYFDEATRTVFTTYTVLSGGHVDMGESVIVHEMGHGMEEVNPWALAAAAEFLERRTTGEALRPLGTGYGAHEVTKDDKFFNAYVGKEYVANGRRYATEITSMAAENIHRQAAGLMEQDEDCFFFALGQMAGAAKP